MCVRPDAFIKASGGFLPSWREIPVVVLTLCVRQAQRGGVQTAGFPRPRGQTDAPAPAGASLALRLGQRHIGVRRLAKNLKE